MLRRDFVRTSQLKQVNHFKPGAPLREDTPGAHKQISQLLRLPDDVIMFILFIIRSRLNVSRLCDSGYLPCLKLPPFGRKLSQKPKLEQHCSTLLHDLPSVQRFVFLFLPVQQHAVVLRAQI